MQPLSIFFKKIQTTYLKFCSGHCCNFSYKIEVNWVYWKTNKTPEVKVTHFNYKVFPVGEHSKCRSGVSPICKSQRKGQWLLSSTDYNLHFKEQKCISERCGHNSSKKQTNQEKHCHGSCFNVSHSTVQN